MVSDGGVNLHPYSTGRNVSLTKLDLSHTRLGPDACLVIAESLKVKAVCRLTSSQVVGPHTFLKVLVVFSQLLESTSLSKPLVSNWTQPAPLHQGEPHAQGGVGASFCLQLETVLLSTLEP